MALWPDGFLLHDDERALRDPALIGSAKNISLGPGGRLKHARAQRLKLKTMMARFAAFARDAVETLAPHYRGSLLRGRTSFRPAEIEGRPASPLRDDRRLHVDAFPATPMRGQRILRVFANVNDTAARHWQIGEPFETMAARFLPRARPKPRLVHAVMAAARITKGRRSVYDDLMLALHDGAKLDLSYQAAAPKTPVAFPPGAVWICFTDVVMHAALKGQFALEQSFYLPVEAMADPAQSPLRILERMTGKTLV